MEENFVVIVLEFAKEALAELNDTAVFDSEDTLVLQEKGTRLDQLCSLNFFISSSTSLTCSSRSIAATSLSWTNTVLGVALILILLTTISSFAISFSRVSLVVLSKLDTTLKQMSFYTHNHSKFK